MLVSSVRARILHTPTFPSDLLLLAEFTADCRWHRWNVVHIHHVLPYPIVSGSDSPSSDVDHFQERLIVGSLADDTADNSHVAPMTIGIG